MLKLYLFTYSTYRFSTVAQQPLILIYIQLETYINRYICNIMYCFMLCNGLPCIGYSCQLAIKMSICQSVGTANRSQTRDIEFNHLILVISHCNRPCQTQPFPFPMYHENTRGHKGHNL